ncbi:MAG TPA: tetratricopeptide repeat protein [Edaphocola sp.]|nr:tetratricopeptide repeat protein [Edaphocola sp.]
MIRTVLRPFRFYIVLGMTFAIFSPRDLRAQFAESTQKENGLLFHGIEQYQQGHYSLSAATLKDYIRSAGKNVTVQNPKTIPDADLQKANYYLSLSEIKSQAQLSLSQAQQYLQNVINPDYKSHIALNLAQYYFRQGQLQNAIRYYEQADIAYLGNEEIADKKFELAYSYFNNQQFAEAKPLFAAIKDLPKSKYYIPGNYYYGLLAYNDKDYDNALKSFEKVDQEPTYKDVVPYYEAEIYYFSGDHEKVLDISRKYLLKDSLYYTKDMELLTAQTLFEQKKYADALPFFEKYYANSDKIRKEELYELAYCYYRLNKWPEAIKRFQPLSNAHDSLGQTSMYLLGDCYLKVNDKQGARNAFDICSGMNFNPSQTEAASFLYAQLSDELGFTGIATQKFNDFITTYPNSKFTPQATTLLSQLLTRSNNYAEAFRIMSNLPPKNQDAWQIYQKVAVGKALQDIQNNRLSQADSIFNLSLQQPVNPEYEAITYFWKGEIAYRTEHYQQAINFCNTFISKAQYNAPEIKAISANANIQNAQMIIGYAQMKLGDYSNAGQAFAQAQKTGGSNNSANALATLHEADAYFMQRNFQQAGALYKDAIAKGTSNPDYARYQLSLVNGLLGDNAAKKQLLQELISKQPVSDYRPEAQYELALTQLNEGDLDNATSGFEQIMSGQAPENIKAKSLIKLAYAYQLKGNQDKAIDNYEEFLLTYPADTNRNVASDALRSLYVAKGEPDKYVAFLKEHNLPSPNQSTIEGTYYDAAIQDFNKENWAAAINGFSKYLAQFTNGKNAVKAHFYRGVSNEKVKKYPEALQDFDTVLNAGWSDFSAEAAASAARIAFTRGDYESAAKYYGRLRDVTVDRQLLQIAYEGLMKSDFELTKFDETAAFADTLLTLPDLPANIQAQARLFKAKALQKNNYPDEALSLYQELDKANMGTVSAEARYRIAEISFEKGNLKKAEKEAGYAVQSSAGQDYWVVKCYLLLGDILTEEKDYFNAKATLSSIVKNTNIAPLKKEATEKLEKVKALEQAQSKLKDN